MNLIKEFLNKYWFNRFEILHEGEGGGRESNGMKLKSSVIRISTTIRSDSGIYICRASNSFGTDESFFKLRILGEFYFKIYFIFYIWLYVNKSNNILL